MPEQTTDEESRLDALVHYVCARCENPSDLGATKLNKVLWYSDVMAFAQQGKSITGAKYIKRQFGPVPRDILESRSRLHASGALVDRVMHHYGYPQRQFIALRPADISMFSANEISLVDTVIIEICGGHTATSISRHSHDLVWHLAEIGEDIPIAAGAFGGNLEEIDEDDMAWARSEIDRIESGKPSA